MTDTLRDVFVHLNERDILADTCSAPVSELNVKLDISGIIQSPIASPCSEHGARSQAIFLDGTRLHPRQKSVSTDSLPLR